MNLRTVRTRIAIGVSAWLLGVGAATGGSLLAVSRLGAGFVTDPGRQLTVAEVNQALASESAEPAAPAPSVSLGRTSSPITKPTRDKPSPQAASSGPQSTDGTWLTSRGGSVMAQCTSSGASLVLWTPQQGYEARNVVRSGNPQVTFSSPSSTVTMYVSCHGGVPSAVTRTQGGGGGGGDS